MIKSIGRSGNLSEAGILAEDLGIYGGGKDISNEIEILKSRPIITKTIERIKANVTYTGLGRIKDTELYNESPIKLDIYKLPEGITSFTFYIKVGYYNDFEFRLKPEEKGAVYNLGEGFKNDYGEFLINRNYAAKMVPGPFRISIMQAEDVAAMYKNSLQIEVVGIQVSSSILELKLTDQSPEKAKDFINTVIAVYNEEEISDNTQVLKNTISFIDERMHRLTDELNEVEGDIERFKSENEIITENASASLAFALEELRSSVAKLSSYEVQQELLRSLEEDLSQHNNDLIPTNVASADPSLGGLINEYNTLFLTQKKLSETVSEESPLIINNQNRLDDIKKLILVSIQNLQQDLKIPVEKTKLEINRSKKDLGAVPVVEKQLLEKLRMQSVKENLFLFLLQKKEETALSMAITTANTRVIEPARSSKRPVFPQKKLVLMGSILLGLFLPILIIAGISFFETTINSEEMLKNITSIPIVGRIPHNKTKEKIIISNGDRSAIAEMFRLLRTNLNYLNLYREKQVILITSSVSGEGKSVIALNLGLTIALSGKKVVVVDLDLRKPKVSEYLGSGNKVGITNYLTGQSELEEIINSYPNNKYFSYIVSGPIPPNPAELIMSGKMKALLGELKKEFDYILLDSPPMVVADALLLRDFITNTLFVVRYKYTRKEILKYLEELHTKGELVKPSLILNDIKVNRHHYGYGGYHAYYGSGYYANQE